MIRCTAWELLNPKGTQILLILQRFFNKVVLSKLVLNSQTLLIFLQGFAPRCSLRYTSAYYYVRYVYF